MDSSLEDKLFSDIEITDILHRLPKAEMLTVVMRTAGYTWNDIGEVLGYTRPAIRYISKKAEVNLQREIGR